jgi:hypothetical protein
MKLGKGTEGVGRALFLVEGGISHTDTQGKGISGRRYSRRQEVFRNLSLFLQHSKLLLSL